MTRIEALAAEERSVLETLKIRGAVPTIKQVSRAYTRLAKMTHPHLGGKFVKERASNAAGIAIRAFQLAKRAAEFDSYFNAGKKKWTLPYEDGLS